MQIFKMADKLICLGSLGPCQSVNDIGITFGLKNILSMFQQLFIMYSHVPKLCNLVSIIDRKSILWEEVITKV